MNLNDSLVILIDDDPISNMLTAETIDMSCPEAKILAFTDPAEGLENVVSNLIKGVKIILLLDINMPLISGWDIVNKISSLEIGELAIKIYMLSSSVDIKDKLKAHNYKLVAGYFEKPIYAKDFEDILFKRNYTN